MKVFVTGATGFVGSAVVKELLKANHQVLGMVRSSEGARKLEALGAEAHFGDLKDLDSLRKGAEKADGLIHTAFNHDDFKVYKESCENDRRIIEALGEVFAGSDRPMVTTSALGIMPRGRMVYESDSPVAGANPRIASEEAADVVADKGVCISVVRLPPTVHGEGDHGFIHSLIEIARQKGIAVYHNAPVNYWPAIHRLDAARLYSLALESSLSGGRRYHAVAEQGVSLQDIAAAIGSGLSIPVIGKSEEDAAEHFGAFAYFAAMNVMASSEETKRILGWQPTGPDLITDMKDVYFKD